MKVKNDHRSKLGHCTSIAEVTGSNPVEALIFFFRLLLSNCLNWKIYCDDHSSLSYRFHIARCLLSNFNLVHNSINLSN